MREQYKHDDQNDNNNERIGIRQFFARQNFPNPDSSIFSTVKTLRHTVSEIHLIWQSLQISQNHQIKITKLKSVQGCVARRSLVIMS